MFGFSKVHFDDYSVEIGKVSGEHALYFLFECVDVVQFESFTFINDWGVVRNGRFNPKALLPEGGSDKVGDWYDKWNDI